MMSDCPLVSIQCLVYNHEPYLRQCLDGFVMQKTDFPFEAIVHDDCSTDGSASIIKEYADKYPTIIKPIFEKENQYSKIGFSGINNIMLNQSKGMYIASCEGDDYWTDPYKLQKQVNCLENNPDCLLVYTGFDTVDANGQIINRPYFDIIKRHSRSGDIFFMQIVRNHVMTVSVCYKKNLIESELYSNSPFGYDYSLSLCASLLGNVIFLPETTCCYRKTPGSMIVSNKSKVSNELNIVRKYYCLAYLKGLGFQRGFYDDIIIKYRLLRTYLYEKSDLRELIDISPSLRLLLPIARMMDIIKK